MDDSASSFETDSVENIILGWLRTYLIAIEREAELTPYPNGWVAVPCPQPSDHHSDPRLAPPTFAINVATGNCRCSVCGNGGTILALKRAMQNYVAESDVDVQPRKREYSKFVASVQGEINVGAFQCRSKHFYRDEKGTAYCAALREPQIAQNHPAQVVYAHRHGERWILGLPTQRELYQGELLAMDQVRLIVVVSDEPSADAVQGELSAMAGNPNAPEGAATTWLGTHRSWQLTDGWVDVASGNNVIMWPDQTQRSIDTMLSIADTVSTTAAQLWFLDVGRSALPHGCTPADAITEGASIFDLMTRYAMRVDPNTATQRRVARMYDAMT